MLYLFIFNKIPLIATYKNITTNTRLNFHKIIKCLYGLDYILNKKLKSKIGR